MSNVTIEAQMEKILDDYSREVVKTTNEVVDSVSKEAVQKLKNTSPRRTGKYAKGWKVKKERGLLGITRIIVHNATSWQLTHLLENGHVVRNKKGTYGRTNGIKHIAPVEQWAADETLQRIERKLR